MQNHMLLKFNHGVEIGARLAYLGHYARTGDESIKAIATDELNHRRELKHILSLLGEKPSPFIDRIFIRIGKTIGWLCKFCPLWSLDLVARSMEMFAVFNYEKLALKYPEHFSTFKFMARAENAHALYFKNRFVS